MEGWDLAFLTCWVFTADIDGEPGSTELFDLLTAAGRESEPAQRILAAAVQLPWPLLALLAACYGTLHPLHCLAGWLHATLETTTHESGTGHPQAF